MASSSGTPDSGERKKKGGEGLKELDPPPEFLGPRLEMFERLKKEYDQWVEAQESMPITVTLPDGKTVSGSSWKTTACDVAAQISKGLADNTVIAKVNM
jgi:threonyl-tRNA synthetase